MVDSKLNVEGTVDIKPVAAETATVVFSSMVVIDMTDSFNGCNVVTGGFALPPQWPSVPPQYLGMPWEMQSLWPYGQ